jgi:hypothetical protein
LKLKGSAYIIVFDKNLKKPTQIYTYNYAVLIRFCAPLQKSLYIPLEKLIFMLKNLPVTFTTLFCICSILFSAGYVHSQPDPLKFGKVELQELQMAKYDKDTSASALILCDYGQSYFKYTHKGFQMYFDRHVRIKILKNQDISGQMLRSLIIR